jgi:hypothetical protein
MQSTFIVFCCKTERLLLIKKFMFCLARTDLFFWFLAADFDEEIVSKKTDKRILFRKDFC